MVKGHQHHRATEQTQRSYLQQDRIFESTKHQRPRFRNSNGDLRYWKNIGLGFATPKEAVQGNYIDKKCPFTGKVSIRGRILSGIVHSTKMKNTIIVRRNYLHYESKYGRYEKRHKNISAHCSPAFTPSEGDEVTLGECRPLSKTVRFNVLKVTSRGSKQDAAGGKKFAKF